VTPASFRHPDSSTPAATPATAFRSTGRVGICGPTLEPAKSRPVQLSNAIPSCWNRLHRTGSEAMRRVTSCPSSRRIGDGERYQVDVIRLVDREHLARRRATLICVCGSAKFTSDPSQKSFSSKRSGSDARSPAGTRPHPQRVPTRRHSRERWSDASTERMLHRSNDGGGFCCPKSRSAPTEELTLDSC